MSFSGIISSYFMKAYFSHLQLLRFALESTESAYAFDLAIMCFHVLSATG